MELEKKLYAEIKEYCQLNDLKIGEFLNKLVKEAFLREKYGDAPPFTIKKIQEPVMEDKVEDVKLSEPENKTIKTVEEPPVVKKPKKRNLY